MAGKAAGFCYRLDRGRTRWSAQKTLTLIKAAVSEDKSSASSSSQRWGYHTFVFLLIQLGPLVDEVLHYYIPVLSSMIFCLTGLFSPLSLFSYSEIVRVMSKKAQQHKTNKIGNMSLGVRKNKNSG